MDSVLLNNAQGLKALDFLCCGYGLAKAMPLLQSLTVLWRG